MHDTVLKLMRSIVAWTAVLAITAIASMPAVHADEAQAKALFKAMSDYLAAQKAISFEYDTNLDIVTKDGEKLGLASWAP